MIELLVCDVESPVRGYLSYTASTENKRVTNIGYARLEVLTPVVMNSPVFCDITPCSPVESHVLSREGVWIREYIY
jgi:hypothetical protein